jgi:thiamine transport system permease protein
LARYQFAGRRVLLALVSTAFVLPTVVVGAAFLALLPPAWHRTAWAIIAAHVYFNCAVVVRVVGSRWEQLHPHLVDAARTLGASPLHILRTITLPLLRPALSAASAVVFLFSFTSYGVVRLLGGPARSTIETEIYLRAVHLDDLSGATALSLLQLAVLALLMWWWLQSAAARHSSSGAVFTQVRRPRTAARFAAVYGIGALTAAAVLAPLLALLLRSLRVGGTLSSSGWRAVFAPGVGSVVHSPLAAVLTSLQFALVTSICATLLGLATACAIAYGSRRLALLDALVMLPLAASAVTLGLGMLITFSAAPLNLRAAWIITPLAHTLIALPLVVRMLLPVVRAVPQGAREAAAVLGAAPWRVWLSIDLPLVARAAMAAAAFAFAVSLGEFGASSFLTRRTTATLPVEIARLLARPGDLVQAQGFVLATVLVLFTVTAIAAVDGLRPERLTI